MIERVHAPLPAPPDQAARNAIVRERGRNVAVVAGAGTGKTKTIIDRAVELLAPTRANSRPVRIQSMALITFTRRAAGELRFRIREQLLRELQHAARRDGERVGLLRDALGNLDAAFVGTIHGFADRLLRLRPVEAALSPSYTLVEDTSELVHETFLRLRRAAEGNSLAKELGVFGAGVDPALVNQAAETLRAATRAGLQMAHSERAFGAVASLEAIMARMIDTRDIITDLGPVPDPQLEQARNAAQRLAQMVKVMRGAEAGHRAVRLVAHGLKRLAAVDDPADAFRIVQDALGGRELQKGRDFNNDPTGWDIYKALRPSGSVKGGLAAQLKGPHRWLAMRLVRLFPVVLAMYERVKAEHEVVDYLDLLIKLRNLLRDDLDARRFYQQLFEHIFVDEFQDTDPLQCEIVFYLCEEPGVIRLSADSGWAHVRLAPGKLTIVGDPKQSIYRFRRADIAVYALAIERLLAGGALARRLETNFRSRAELISFFNRQLGTLLGRQDGPALDPQTGRANYEDLSPSAVIPPAATTVHVLPYADPQHQGLLATDGRAVEAAMIAHYVRWLLDTRFAVRDPDTNVERRIRPGDIAILAAVTTNVRLLLEQFDAFDIEYSARGGALFLAHPVVRQYLLALRALADRDDGVAEAAILQPPFFALELCDAVVSRVDRRHTSERRARRTEAQAILAALRAQRHTQSPGATARDLIERIGLGRTVITARNGRQTLAALYAVAAEVDRRAAIERCDYDATTELFRAWAENPVVLDTPEPLGPTALRVMTTHSAKGLEFPVVILWDGFQTFNERGGTVWHLERDGRAWALNLGPVAIEQPAGALVLEREKQFGDQERRRLYYVAATRARDLLVLPEPLTKSKRLHYATSELAQGTDLPQLQRFEPFTLERLPAWARNIGTPTADVVGDPALTERIRGIHADFACARATAAEPIAVPTAVSLEAAAAGTDDDSGIDAERLRKTATGRFGPIFGAAVHRGIEFWLTGSTDTLAAATALAADAAGLTEHRAQAHADVERAVEALRQFGVTRTGPTVATEYPLAATWQGGKLLTGFVDLLVLTRETILILDFKTDAPVDGPLSGAYPHYAEQLRLYGELLRTTGVVGSLPLRLGLLLTASGEVRWL